MPLLADSADQANYQFDWQDALPNGVSLVSVVHTVPIPLEIVSETTDTASKKSTVMVRGGVHGMRYLLHGLATLDNGETLRRQGVLRIFVGSAE